MEMSQYLPNAAMSPMDTNGSNSSDASTLPSSRAGTTGGSHPSTPVVVVRAFGDPASDRTKAKASVPGRVLAPIRQGGVGAGDGGRDGIAKDGPGILRGWQAAAAHPANESAGSMPHRTVDTQSSPADPAGNVPDKIVDVKVRMTVFQLSCIDTSEQAFEVDGWFKASWRDPSIPGRKQPIIYARKGADASASAEEGGAAVPNAWSPMLTFHNCSGSDLTIMEENFHPREGSTGEDLDPVHGQYVSYSMRFSGRFSNVMQLHRFPFDSQHLRIVLTSDVPLFMPKAHFTRKLVSSQRAVAVSGSTAHAGPSLAGSTAAQQQQGAAAVAAAAPLPLGQLAAGPGRESDGLLDYCRFWRVRIVPETNPKYPSAVRDSRLVSTWAIQNRLTFTTSHSSLADSGSGCVYARVAGEILVARYPGFYVSNIVCTLYFIIAAAFASFFVDYKDLPSRCSITLTMFLTAIAYKYAVTTYLPAISYLTYLDMYILSGILMLATILVQNCIVSTMTLSESLYPNADTIFGIVVFCVWCLINLLVFAMHVRCQMALQTSSLVTGEQDDPSDDSTSRVHERHKALGGAAIKSSPQDALEDEFYAFIDDQATASRRN